MAEVFSTSLELGYGLFAAALRLLVGILNQTLSAAAQGRTAGRPIGGLERHTAAQVIAGETWEASLAYIGRQEQGTTLARFI